MPFVNMIVLRNKYKLEITRCKDDFVASFRPGGWGCGGADPWVEKVTTSEGWDLKMKIQHKYCKLYDLYPC